MVWILFSRYSSGDTNVPFSLQSCSKPLTYCMVQSNDDNIERVHKYVGHEPSGRSFNEISLDYQSMERYIISINLVQFKFQLSYACPHFHTIVNSIQKVNWQKFRDQFDSFLLMLRMSLQWTSNDSNKHVVSFNSLLYCQNLMYEVGLISEKPHNPMINSGAIIVSSLLKPELALPDRFDWVISLLYSKLTFICDNLPLHFSYEKRNLRN